MVYAVFLSFKRDFWWRVFQRFKWSIFFAFHFSWVFLHWIKISWPFKNFSIFFNWKNCLIFQVFQSRWKPCSCSTPHNSFESSCSFRHMALSRMVHSFCLSSEKNTTDNTTKKDIFYRKQLAHFNKRFCEKLEARNFNVIIQYVLYFKHFKNVHKEMKLRHTNFKDFLF